MMFLKVFPSGPLATNAMVLASDRTKKAIVIDPSLGSFEFLAQALRDFHPEGIFLTHSHWDHFADAAALKKRFNLPVYVHPADATNLQSPGSDGLPMLGEIEGIKPDFLFRDGEVLNIGDLEIYVIYTPGHSPGGVCFYLPKENTLISGDTLFKGTIGNLGFPTAEPKKMWESLKKLAKLPPETKVYPGHGGITTIGDEPWLKDFLDKKEDL